MTLFNVDSDRDDKNVKFEPENKILIEFKLNSKRLENRLLMPCSVVKQNKIISFIINRDANVNDSSIECASSSLNIEELNR